MKNFVFVLLLSVLGLAVGCSDDVKRQTVTTSYPPAPSANLTPPAPKPAPPPAPLVYDPPCGPGSDAHVCTEQITEKSKVSGRIHTVTFHGTETDPNSEDHIVPDYTEVEYDPCNGDDCEYAQVKFCGNQLDSFDPGKTLNMIVKDSNLTEYNGCYMITVTVLTNGGKPISRYIPKKRSTVPGSFNQ